MKIKICGIRSKDDIDLVNKYKPDFIGFIFFRKSKRFIEPGEALSLKEQLTYPAKTVGVFVDENPEYVLNCFEKGIFDLAQLHGNESPESCLKLQSKGLPIIKAFRIAQREDFDKTKMYKSDYFLFDVKSDKFVGGTGESFNWDLLREYSGDTPYFLAGGIGVNNIDKALKTKASILDVSSSIETNFKKDKSKIDNLFKIYRKLNV